MLVLKQDFKMKVLIVEDHKVLQENLQRAVKIVVPKFYPDFDPNTDRHLSCTYENTQKLTERNQYGIILLDYRIPMAESSRFDDAYSFRLIEEIRKRNQATIIIGTSEVTQEQARAFARPDYTMRRARAEDAETDLEKILRRISQMESLK